MSPIRRTEVASPSSTHKRAARPAKPFVIARELAMRAAVRPERGVSQPADRREDAPRETSRHRRGEADRDDLAPFTAPPPVLVPRREAPIVSAPPASSARVAETQALVERLVTSMRVGRSARGAEVHMKLDGARDTEVRVRDVNGRLEIDLRGDDTAALGARIEAALRDRGLVADVRTET